ncbi:MAG: phosphate-starvation-inducible PsiE family protein [Sulfurimonas sp.]|nr:phosphate-starvation-inducible PsiE family protein [Sulfurimonas sp.]
MQQHQSLKEHYKFTKEEALILKELQPRMEELSNRFIEEFYDYIWGFGSTAKFLKNQKIIDYHRTKIKAWFVNLFCGKYDLEYFTYLYKIGEIHVRIGLPTHYVNSAFTFVRTFVIKNLHENSQDDRRSMMEIDAVEKIIDINLDTLTSSYREEELGKFLSMSKFEKTVLSGLKRFNSYVNFFLAGSLALVAFFAIGLFGYDIYLLFFSDIGIEKGILTVLGSLLVLWAAIELIHEEIEHLQGKGFAIGAFIMLAMAALIRKVLIYSLSSESGKELLVIGAVIVALAVSYWLVGVKKIVGVSTNKVDSAS